jgi:hypothetical protein
MNTVEIEGQHYEISGYADDGLPIIKAVATSTQDGFDEDGNPKISVNVVVPAASLFAAGGEQG